MEFPLRLYLDILITEIWWGNFLRLAAEKLVGGKQPNQLLLALASSN
jgi:hypothetical protein